MLFVRTQLDAMSLDDRLLVDVGLRREAEVLHADERDPRLTSTESLRDDLTLWAFLRRITALLALPLASR